MRGRRKLLFALGLVAVVSVGSLAGGDDVTATGAIVLHEGSGETFLPDTSTAPVTGLLSPDVAYRRYVGRSHAQIPPGTSVQRGYLTLPVGPGAPGEHVIDHALVYAYTSTFCGPRSGPVIPNGDVAVEREAPRCRQWLFLDARTGELLDLTWTR